MPIVVFCIAVVLHGLTVSDPFSGAAHPFEPIVWGILLLAAASRLWTGTTRWVAPFLLTGGLLSVRVFALADAGCLHYLRRPLELTNDIRLLPDLKTVLTDTGGYQTIWALLAALLGFACLSWLLLRTLRGHARFVLAAAALSLGVGAALGDVAKVSTRSGAELASLVNPDDLEERMKAEHALAVAKLGDMTQRVWRNRDVHVFIVESYGMTVFDHPKLRPFVERVLPEFQKRMATHEIGMVSGSYRSPTFGGRSWLAHATIDTGVMVTDQERFERLLDSDLPAVATHFRRAGYATATIAPGIVNPFPEGGYFGYEKTLYFEQLGYDGPRYGWSTVPDQWLLNRIPARLHSVDRPLFAEWHLVSTHAPFAEHAPFLSPEQLSALHPYRDLESTRFPIQWPYLENAHEGFRHALEYEFDTLADVIPSLISERGLVVIVGDHQPNGAMTEWGASWNVPCHVLSTSETALAYWRARGFASGIRPASEQVPPLSELNRDLLHSETLKVETTQRGHGDPP